MSKQPETTLMEFLEANPEWDEYKDLLLCPPSAQEIKDEFPDVSDEVLDRAYDVMPAGYTRGAFYIRIRHEGQSPSMAEMFTLQKGPGLDTDDVFFSGSKPLYDQFGSQKHLDRFLKQAKARGFTPSVNSTYYPNLARFPGDPEAFVTRAQGRSYIKKLCEDRGWACEGGVKVEHRQPERDPYETAAPLANDIVAESMADELKKNPEMSKQDRRNLRAKVVEKHAHKWQD